MNQGESERSSVAADRPPRGVISDGVFRIFTRLAAWIVLASVLGILIALTVGAWPAFRTFGAQFLTSAAWNPVTEQFGAAAPVYGTLVTSAIALLFGVPVSFGIAVFLNEVCPAFLRRPIGTSIELLAAIPSIIYGMWGLFVFAPIMAEHVQPWMLETFDGWPVVGRLLQGPPIGIGVFTAGLILAIMSIPFMAAVMRDVFSTVPASLRESGYALGATKWEVIRRVVLPYTKVGVVGGIMLGLGRALGETMAVTFVIGNAHEVNAALFLPGNTISSTLANEFTEAVGPLYTSSLIGLGLVLFLITFLVLVLAKLLLLRMQAREGKVP